LPVSACCPLLTWLNSLWVKLNTSAEVCQCCVVVFGCKGFVAQLFLTRRLNLAAAAAAAARQLSIQSLYARTKRVRDVAARKRPACEAITCSAWLSADITGGSIQLTGRS
jgi:hypothetical protein